jgi:hypothetical protein
MYVSVRAVVAIDSDGMQMFDRSSGVWDGAAYGTLLERKCGEAW